jgi:fused signal recognition particle receptor
MMKWFRRKPDEPKPDADERVQQIPAEPEPPAREPVAETPPEPGPEPEPLPEPEPAPPPPPPPPAPAPAAEAPKAGWFARLRQGLSRSTQKLSDGIAGIFTKRKLDDEAIEELEELLIQADLGPAMAARITAELARTRFGKEVTPEEVRSALAAEMEKALARCAAPLEPDPAIRPFVVLVVGVNGTGKTTTIGKLARQFTDRGLKVRLAAGDTFRAAAVQQLRIWGERTGCEVVTRAEGADPAGLAYDAVEAARAAGDDVLLIDTAGRLHNKDALMAELQKVVRVIRKVDPSAPHATILTLDATTGQNAVNQVQVFRDMVEVSGLVVTKLDGTAKGGVVVALADRFGLPVHAVGVGEGAEDLRPFEPRAFARSLAGLD